MLKQTVSPQTEQKDDPPMAREAERFTVIETLADVFARHNNILVKIREETGITNSTLIKYRNRFMLNNLVFIRDSLTGLTHQFTMKPLPYKTSVPKEQEAVIEETPRERIAPKLSREHLK